MVITIRISRLEPTLVISASAMGRGTKGEALAAAEAMTVCPALGGSNDVTLGSDDVT